MDPGLRCTQCALKYVNDVTLWNNYVIITGIIVPNFDPH